jgi:hypothetical protein
MEMMRTHSGAFANAFSKIGAIGTDEFSIVI